MKRRNQSINRNLNIRRSLVSPKVANSSLFPPTIPTMNQILNNAKDIKTQNQFEFVNSNKMIQSIDFKNLNSIFVKE